MNTVNLIGRITKDLELQKTQSGKSVCKFTIAVDGYNEHTDFISCIAWNKQAENIVQYFGKGVKIGVVGHLLTGSYEKNGQKVYTTDVVVDGFDFCEKRQTNQQSNKQSANYYETGTEIASDDLPF